MPESGFAVEYNIDPQGSELDQAALATDTVLYVGDASAYDPGMAVEVNEFRLMVASTDTDAGTVTLTTPLGVAADIGDRVFVVAGGEVANDYTLDVVTSDGESLEIPVDFSDRALWVSGPIDPPVPVTLTDDLVKVLDAPGRAAIINPLATPTPLFIGYLDVDQAIPSSLDYQYVTGWVPQVTREGMIYNGVFATVEVPLDGYYSVTAATLWQANSTGRRGIKPMYGSTAFGLIEGSEFKIDASSSQMTTPTSSALKPCGAGDTIAIQVTQNSGGSLNILGDSAGIKSWFQVEYRGPL